MSRWRALLLLVIAAPAAGTDALAQGRGREMHVDVAGGASWSLPTRLVVHRPGVPPLRIQAHYSTKPFFEAWYYAYRIGVGTTPPEGQLAGFEVEMVHHKLYLDNPAPPIERFQITHGYNLLTANVLRPWRRATLRLGIGVVIAHPEGTIAGEVVGGSRRTVIGGGYHIAGITMQLSLAHRFERGTGLGVTATPEGKVTTSYARVPLGDDGGSVVVPNVALHALAGLGISHQLP